LSFIFKDFWCWTFDDPHMRSFDQRKSYIFVFSYYFQKETNLYLFFRDFQYAGSNYLMFTDYDSTKVSMYIIVLIILLFKINLRLPLVL
jgi:hypothetical protein